MILYSVNQNSDCCPLFWSHYPSSSNSWGQVRGAKTHEIYAVTFGGHLFMTYFYREAWPRQSLWIHYYLANSCEKLQSFFVPTNWQCIKFGFECPYHLWLSTPLKLHLFSSKRVIHRSPPPPKIMGKSQKFVMKICLKPKLCVKLK